MNLNQTKAQIDKQLAEIKNELMEYTEEELNLFLQGCEAEHPLAVLVKEELTIRESEV